MDGGNGQSQQSLTLGGALRGGRVAKRLSQETAAKQLEVSQPTLSAWENDQRAPSLDRLAKAAHIYGLDFAGLLAAALEQAGPAPVEPVQ